MKYYLLAAVLLFCAKAHAQLSAVSCTTFNTTCTFASTTNGSALWIDEFTYGAGTVSAPTGCEAHGNSWVKVPNLTYSGFGAGTVWILRNIASGGCTVTPNGTGSVYSVIFEVNADPVYPLSFPIQPEEGNPPSGQTWNFVTGEPQELLIACANVQGDPHATSATGSFSSPVIATDGAAGIACFTKSVTPGSYSTTLSGGSFLSVTSALRQNAPTFGPVQANDCEGSGGNVTGCALPYAPTSGDLVDEIFPCAQYQYTLTNSPSATGYLLPANAWYHDSWIYQNVSSTPVSFSGSYSNCGTPNMVLIEMAGLPAAHSYADGSGNFDLPNTFGGGTTTTWPSGPIHLLSAGRYGLLATVASIGNQSITVPSGFYPLMLDQVGAINGTYYQTVTPPTQASYNFTTSWGTGVGSPDASLYAFSQTAYTFSHVIQSMQAIAIASAPFSFINPTTSGSDAVCDVSLSTASGSVWGFSSTYGTPALLRGGANSDPFELYAINGITASSGTITPTGGGGTNLLSTCAEIWPAPTAIQTGNSNNCSTSPCSSGNVTTTNPTTTLVSGGNSCCASSNVSYIDATDTSWTLVQQGSQENGGNNMYAKTVFTPGTWNQNNVQAGAVTDKMTAWIVPLTLPPIANTEPNVTVITKNEVPFVQMGEMQ